MNERGLKVAQDILKNLQTLRIQEGHYLNLIGMRYEIGEMEGDLQDNIDVVQSSCEVCLLGACLLSKARIYDAVGMEQFIALEQTCCDDDIRSALEDVFDAETLNMFEAAFEQDYFSWNRDTAEGLLIDAVAFGERFRDPKERAKAVMENYIVNNGKFIP